MPSATYPAVELDHVSRRFGEVVALDDVCLSVPAGEAFSLLGPSGCGKTTLLRIIAGLESADAGRVLIDGRDAGDLPAHRRPVNTVFQSYALFPHLEVWDNIAFGLRMKGIPRPELERRVKQVMALVAIEPLAQRRPAQLSGGQKQRVALARALVNEPRVLLLDEPLAALDLKLRKQLQLELRRLQRRLQLTFIYVTHDQEEALTLSDRLAVMRAGRIEQLDQPQTLYERPRTRFVAQFLGSCNLLEARLPQATPEGWVAETALGPLRIASAPPRPSPFTLAIRPERIQLLPAHPRPAADNLVRAQVEQRLYVGAETHYELRANGHPLRVETMNSGRDSGSLRPGQEVFVELPPAALILLDD